MKGKREQYLVPALAFAIPAAVMLWVYAALGIAPFGERTLKYTPKAGLGYYASLRPEPG